MKFLNRSKAAQAGERTTMSPGWAAALASFTAPARSPAMKISGVWGPYPSACSTAWRMAGAVSPVRTRVFTRSTISRPSWVKGTPLSYPPAIRMTFWGKDSRQAVVRVGLVPMESLYQRTPSSSRTNSIRCSTP